MPPASKKSPPTKRKPKKAAAKPKAPRARSEAAISKAHVKAQLKETSSGLARALVAAAGSESKERAAMKIAIAQYMKIREAAPGADPVEYLCAEFFVEGDTHNASIFDQMGEVDDDERDRLFELLGEVAGYNA